MKLIQTCMFFKYEQCAALAVVQSTITGAILSSARPCYLDAGHKGKHDCIIREGEIWTRWQH